MLDMVLGADPKMVVVSNNELSIGAFSRVTSLTQKALRVYERDNLLTPARVDLHNGYRWYSTEQIHQARLIGLLRGLDMSLDEIRRLLALDSGVASMLLAAWWFRRDHEHRSRRVLLGHIQSIIKNEESSMYEVHVRHIPAHRVMSVQRRVRQPDLEQFILDTWAKFEKHLDGQEPTGEYTVLYHGRVEADLDGPVEAIMGCPESTQASDAIGIRTEPAHDVAYTRLTKSQFMFPEILGAYDAVASSPEVQERGSTELTCREIYLGGWAELADDDPAGDIAFPLA
jgi:DNA-binding transcriptional MerR regulator